MYLFYEQNRKNDIVWWSQEDKVPVAKTFIKSAYANIWGTMSASGLSAIHIMPRGQTVDAEYYVEDILEKEVKPLFKISKRTNEATTNKMVVNKRRFTFQQDGAPAHTSKHAQDWCLQNVPNFINKDDWPAISPDLNPMENLFQHSNRKSILWPRTSDTGDELKNVSERLGGQSLLTVSNPLCTVCQNA